MNKKVLYTLFFLLFTFFKVIAQFEDATIEMGTPTFTDDSFYGHGVCLVDVNKDGWDDVTACTFSNGIIVYENTGSNWIRRTLVTSNGNAKCAVYADYDRDNDLDLFVTFRFGEMRLYRNDGNWSFVDVSAFAGVLGYPLVSTWGATWDDYNKDGWPDIFVVNYDAGMTAFNRLLRNNADGTFTDVASALGVQGGGTFPFMPTFFHANQDNYNDLFVCVDFSPSDRLFLGNSQGSFTNVSNICGLNFSVNNMTSSPGDFDNDGDFDLFLTNTPGNGSYLYKNNGSAVFSNTTATANAAITAWTWGAAWLDYNNDMNLDVAVASQLYNGESSLYLLKGNGVSFQDITPSLFKFVPNSNYAIARGDSDRDGYADIYLNVEDGGYNRLYRNTESGLNSFKVELEGSTSNKEGYGTRLTYFTNGVKRVAQLRCGEQYLAQNSQHLILPTGSNTVIDSLILNWPSGVTDKYFNFQSNKHYHLIESNTSPVQIQTVESEICSGSSTTISSMYNELIDWSSGITSYSITVEDEGVYYGLYKDSRNIYWFTDSVEISFKQTDSVYFSLNPPSCNGQQAGEVCVNNANVFFVQNNNQCLNNLVSGLNEFEISNNGCVENLTVTIPTVSFEVPEFNVMQPSCLNGYVSSVELMSGWSFSGEQLLDSLPQGWNYMEVNLGWCQTEISFEVLNPEIFELEVVATDPLCDDVENFGSIEVQFQDSIQYELLQDGLSIGYNLTGLFDSLSPGSYEINCLNSLGCNYSTSIEINIPQVWDFQESIQHPLCHNDSTGSIVLFSDYDFVSYSLFHGQDTIQSSGFGEFVELPWGEYSVEGITQNGCKVLHFIELNNPSDLLLTVDTMSWDGSFPFTLVSYVENAILPIEYNWSTNCSESFCEFFSSGNVGLEVIDANGCEESWSWSIPLNVENVSTLSMNLNGSFVSFSEDGNVSIYDLLGQILSEGYGRLFYLKGASVYIIRFQQNNGHFNFFKVVGQE